MLAQHGKLVLEIVCYSTLTLHTHLIFLYIVGGIIAPFLFLAKDGPEYHTGYSVSLSFLCISALASTSYFVMCMMENHQRNKRLSDHDEESTDEGKLMGDLHPDYQYML